MKKSLLLVILVYTVSLLSTAQTNPLWTEKKASSKGNKLVKQYSFGSVITPTEGKNAIYTGLVFSY